MNLQKLAIDTKIMLSLFRISFTEVTLISGMPPQFVIESFGTIVCCIDKASYIHLDGKLIDGYKDWRRVFISDKDKLEEKRYEVLWALMRGGYMKWLRYNYPNQIKNILAGHDNLCNRIITERLRIWDNKPMYKFLIEDNLEVKKGGPMMEVSRDPGFFDYMPEQ